jgi:hypothetical protein
LTLVVILGTSKVNVLFLSVTTTGFCAVVVVVGTAELAGDVEFDGAVCVETPGPPGALSCVQPATPTTIPNNAAAEMSLISFPS